MRHSPDVAGLSGHPLALAFAWSDRLRRARGRALDRIGVGPDETPAEIVLAKDGMRLRAYGGPPGGPSLLIVPAPIKRHYIWDLTPGRSVVRTALAAGFAVHLLEWTGPEGEAAGYGLEEVIEQLIGAAADHARAPHDGAVLLAGHSLGGTLATLFAARHPERVRGLVLIEAPLRFAPEAGRLAALARALPRAPAPVEAVAMGAVPGSFLSLAGTLADPVEFYPARWGDAVASAGDPEALVTHLRVLRWALDELPMPGRLFAETADRLFRDDAFARGTLVLAGERVGPERLVLPIATVLDRSSRLVPPAAVLPVLERTPASWTVLWHGQETGTALRHVGALVGRRAQLDLWPGLWGRLAATWGRG
ncbi:alpha/beta fold hydrolase [Benzoatithermus flavus]|uniref:Alpha/beta fold hydrolase n=1 Tax=Benzoatithermus flavus TaxID=3108223 RepID=A0ABU8XUR5_9PROT